MMDGETNREKIRAVFQGRIFALPPVSIRLDLWHNHAISEGTVPGEIHGLSTEEIEDHLGFCRSARYRPRVELSFGIDTCVHARDAQGTREHYRLNGHELRRVVRETEEVRRAGMRGHIVEYPLKDQRDCAAFLEALPDAGIRIETGDFASFDRATGEKGNPLCIVGPSPAHAFMLSWVGYENGYLLRADFPDLIEACIGALEEIYIRDLWPAAGDIDAELILHGAHFSESLTPRPVFEKYFLPYFSGFNRMMHRRGKSVLFHSDSDLGNLAPLMVDAGFDGADCLATRPLVKETMGDYLDAWKGTVVCWGGLPSTLFAPSVPVAEFCRCLDELREATRGVPRVIIGASDNVMPGAQWEKLLAVQEWFETKTS